MNILSIFAAAKGGKAAPAAPSGPPAPAPAQPHSGGGTAIDDTDRNEKGRILPPPPKQADRPFEGFPIPQPNGPLVLAVVEARHIRPTPEEKAEVTALLAERQRLFDFLAANDSKAIRDYARAQSDRILRLIVDGKSAEATDQDVWTHDELFEEARVKRSAAKQRLRVIEEQIDAAIQPISRRIEAAALELCRELEAEERADAERFKIEYRPSFTVATLGQLSWRGAAFPKAVILGLFK